MVRYAALVVVMGLLVFTAACGVSTDLSAQFEEDCAAEGGRVTVVGDVYSCLLDGTVIATETYR